MAEEDDIDEETDESGGDEGEEESGGGKKKPMIIILGVVLLVVGGLAAAYFTGMFDSLLGGGGGTEEQAEGAKKISTTATYFDLDELLVNLNTGGRKSVFLKIRISLELENPLDIPIIESVMPRIIDSFQTYLRELRVEDLRGSAGLYRLREELLLRVSAAASPAKISDVLFKEMLVQ